MICSMVSGKGLTTASYGDTMLPVNKAIVVGLHFVHRVDHMSNSPFETSTSQNSCSAANYFPVLSVVNMDDKGCRYCTIVAAALLEDSAEEKSTMTAATTSIL